MKGADVPSDVDAADDEIAFWRGFIEWWAREREGPVPPRAWQALTLAEARQRASDTETSAIQKRADCTVGRQFS